jgi:hypothetical protein
VRCQKAPNFIRPSPATPASDAGISLVSMKPREARHAGRSKKKKVLLAGGHADDAAALIQRGYDVRGPLGFEEARFRCRRENYDLVLLNLRASPRAAFRLCSEVRRSAPRTSVVFVLDPPAWLPAITCPPDDVVHRKEGLEHMLARLENLLAA